MTNFYIPLEHIKKTAIEGGKILNTKCETDFSKLAHSYCGYELEIYKIEEREPVGFIDPDLTVSLAQIPHQTSYLKKYHTKLPIMCVNVLRLTNTTDIFAFFDYKSPGSLALDFILEHDIKNNDEELRLSPNHRFSTLLHKLKSTGDEKYIFALANKLQLNVDLIKSPTVLYRYKRPSVNSAPRGLLTALQYNEHWYVKITHTYMIQSI